MQTKEILVVLTDKWADWEAAFALPALNDPPNYVVKTISADKTPKVSAGGMRTEVDYTTQDYANFNNTAMVIMPGGYTWSESPHEEIAAFVKKAKNANIPIAGICGGAVFLGRLGLLDNIKHTGDDLESFQEAGGYSGEAHLTEDPVVTDGGIITAHANAPVEFAYAIFKLLELMPEEDLEGFLGYFKS